MTSFPNAYLEQAHHHGFRNKGELAHSLVCVCIYCKDTFAFSDIDWWVNDRPGPGSGEPAGSPFVETETAVCPNCHVDLVIGDASGLPVTDKAFVDAIHERWFS